MPRPKQYFKLTPEPGSPESAIRALGSGLALRADLFFKEKSSGPKTFWDRIDAESVFNAFEKVFRWGIDEPGGIAHEHFLRGVSFVLEILTSRLSFNPFSGIFHTGNSYWRLYFGTQYYVENGSRAPAELIGPLCLQVLRRHFGSQRKYFVSTAAKEAVPLHDGHYEVLMSIYCSIVSSFPVRRRLACDGEFLAALVKLTARYFREAPTNGSEKRMISHIHEIVVLLEVCLAEKPRRFLEQFIDNANLKQDWTQLTCYFRDNCSNREIDAVNVIRKLQHQQLFLNYIEPFVERMVPKVIGSTASTRPSAVGIERACLYFSVQVCRKVWSEREEAIEVDLGPIDRMDVWIFGRTCIVSFNSVCRGHAQQPISAASKKNFDSGS